MRNDSDGGGPWRVLVEFQTRPDPQMYGRVLEYLGGTWRGEKASDLPGDRFAVAALVVNLTGKGNTFPAVAWPEAGFGPVVIGRDVNLAEIDAGELLEQAARGEVPMILLAWIPLMQRGDEAGIIARWKQVAGGVTDARLRNDLGYARTFAEAAKRGPLWQEVLMEWTLTESPSINEILVKKLEQEVAKARAESVVEALTVRFRAVPEDLAAAIRRNGDIATLRDWHTRAITCRSLKAFRRDTGL